jgi:hypothetical protein
MRKYKDFSAYIINIATTVGGSMPLLFLQGESFIEGLHAAVCAYRLTPTPHALNLLELSVPS